MIFFVLMILAYSFSNYAYAEHFQIFNNPTPDINDLFGKSISIDRNYVLIGANRDNTGANNAGSVYLFDTSGNLLQTINNPKPIRGDFFGDSVSIYGNNILVGAIGVDAGTEDAGSVYLFNTSGTLLQTFYNPTPNPGDNFGHSVLISGNKVLVGAYKDDTGANDVGSVYLFNTSGNLLHTFNKPNPMPGDNFGLSISISGNYILVGADREDVGAEDVGAVYLFNTSGNLLQTINNPDPIPGSQFGHTVSISGNQILAGAHQSGLVHLFNTSGNLLKTLNDPEPGHDNAFGHWVTISGNKIVVGAHQDDTGANNAGSVYLFDTSGNLLQTINNPSPDLNDHFGHTVSISGNHILVNAYRDDAGAEETGSVYLFDLQHDRTTLLLAAVQASASWIIPVIVSAVGIGLVLVRRKKLNI